MADNEAILSGPAPVNDPSFPLQDGDSLAEHGDYIITCAQNDTPPVWGFWNALKNYAAINGARIVVIPHRYKNPTSTLEGASARRYRWDPAFRDYLVESEVKLHPKLRLMAQVRIGSTVDNPIPSSRFGRSKDASAIYGHPQLTLTSVPTPQNELPKLIYTTGSATEKNYSTTGRGDLAEFHHTTGALIVQVRGDKFFMREISWDGRGFYDHETRYAPTSAFTPMNESPAEPHQHLEALYMGDIHRRFLDPGVERATFGPGGIVEVLRPKVLVAGDIADGISINHHDQGKQVFAAWRAKQNLDCCQSELDQVVEWLNYVSGFAPIVVTPSNHDDFLSRWLDASDTKVEPVNLKLFSWLRWRMIDEMDNTGYGNPLEIFCRGKVDPERVRFLKTDESFQIGPIECGMHGHLGPNGARGSAANLSRIGTKSIIGHSHSPRIFQGVYQVGTSSIFNLSYASGPSSWFHTHAGIYPNGRRMMFHMIDGEWRG